MRTPIIGREEVHALLAAFYENTDNAILITQFKSSDSFECCFLNANQAACEMLGYNQEELLYKNPDEVLFSNISHKLVNFIKERLFETKHASHEIVLRTKDNSNVLVEMASSLVEYTGSRFVIHTFKDIEEKKEVQDNWLADRILLNREREKYYEAIACGITVQDTEGRVVYANQAAADILGVEKEDLIIPSNAHKNWKVFEEDGAELEINEHPWKKAISTRKEIINLVMGFHHPKYKEKRWILVNTRNVLTDGEDSVEKIIATFHDITVKVEMDKVMKEKEKLALAGQLAAGVAHEIRNPLTSSLGFLKMMRNEKIVNQDYLDIILDELERINLVTSDFLALAEPQSLSMEMLRLYEDILAPMAKTLKCQLDKNDLKMNFMVDGSKKSIKGVRDQIKQLFMNILSNSIEAMPDGGIIDVSVIHENRNIVVSIKDEGVGIAPERLRHLGEPFYSIKEKGTGLGLLLCKKIVTEHRGRIVIKSVQERGTIVEISLPVADC